MRSILFLSLFAAACTGTPATTDPAGSEPAATPPADAAATTTEATGTETTAAQEEPAPDAGTADADLPDAAKLDEAKGKVHAMMGKDPAREAIVGVLGEPSSVSDTELMWRGKDGETCKALKVQLMGDFTGNVTVEEVDCAAGPAE